MTRVYCYNYDCTHCDSETCECCLGMISVEGAAYNGCNDYECYLDSKEYREEFFALVGNRGKVAGREKRYGKKIGYNGRTFYTRDKIRANDNFNVTDAKTGLLVGFDRVKSMWDKFIEAADKESDIESFPVVELGADGRYHLVDKGESHES